MITVCLTYFKSLALANLEAALYSVRRQDLSRVEQIVVVDNDTADSPQEIKAVIDALGFSVSVRLLSFKHGDLARTHSWSTNVAVREAKTPWVLFTRADYILDFDVVKRFSELTHSYGFITANVYHLNVDMAFCEQTAWRRFGPLGFRGFPGAEADYTHIDAGVWMARREDFDRVGRLDESLTAWGHAQTDFQYRLHKSGVEFVRIPEVLFYHPQHAATRDIGVAHQQLADRGVDLKELWARYEGVQPYS